MLPNKFTLLNFFLILLNAIAKSESSYRLPKTTVPRFYEIELEPHLLEHEFSFTGKSSIVFEVIEPINSVVLHRSKNIFIDREYTEVINETGYSYPVLQHKWVAENEFIKLKIGDNLQIGNYTLKLHWKGYSNAVKNTGFYRAIDDDVKNNSKYLVATNLREIYARSVFPCWDEPGYRTIYKISVKHPANYHALSNMPIESTRMLSNRTVITAFENTVPISSYQVSVVVSDYKSLSNHDQKLNVYTKKNDSRFFEHVLLEQEKVLLKVEQYTGIPYILPTLNSVTVPQFMKASVATSNPGLITYKAKKVKLISKNSAIVTYQTKKTISQVVVLEVLQQWFENMVSPAWWNDLWLTKGIPVYLQYKFLDQLYPELEATDFETIDSYQFIFITDAIARLNLPSLASVPQSPSLIRKKLNIVNNIRSFVIIQMLEHVVTQDVFRLGLYHFLKDNKYNAVTAEDFWFSLQNAYDEKFVNNSFSIKEHMDPWLNQPGYPILKVTRNYESGLVTVSQSNSLPNHKDVTWSIPISYATRSKPDFNKTSPVTWIKQNKTSIALARVDARDWIILNVQQRGYYKVIYDMKNLELITNYLSTNDFKNIHSINRARIIDDVYNAYVLDNEYFEIAIRIIGYLHHETDYLPWWSGTELIKQIIQSTYIQANELFKSYINSITKNIIIAIGTVESENDSELVLRLRRSLLSIYCRFNYNECKPIAYRIFNSSVLELFGVTNMDAIYSWAMCNVFEDFSPSKWGKFFSADFPIFKKNPDIKFMYLHCANSSNVLEKYLNSIVNSTDNQVDFISVFDNIVHHTRHNHTEFILNYFRNNFDALQNKFLKMGRRDAIPLLIKKLTYNIDNPVLWKQVLRDIHNNSNNVLSIS
ncbi:hypothetical protein KQX54_007077 [Cotesia glomerata]|uniref:Aminopeptidase n=1 Tax=Cotesia glomerata TaxID=32391 RepID=A0AAV7HU82_COTGL|nr:hypothetical protein KQX54_007077 [Cotesia glomerata]